MASAGAELGDANLGNARSFSILSQSLGLGTGVEDVELELAQAGSSAARVFISLINASA